MRRTIRRYPVAKKAWTFRLPFWALGAHWHEGYTTFTFPQMTLVAVSLGRSSDEAGTVIVSAKRKAKEFEYRFVHLLAQTGTTSDAVRNAPRFFAIRRDQLYPPALLPKPRRGETRVARQPED